MLIEFKMDSYNLCITPCKHYTGYTVGSAMCYECKFCENVFIPKVDKITGKERFFVNCLFRGKTFAYNIYGKEMIKR